MATEVKPPRLTKAQRAVVKMRQREAVWTALKKAARLTNDHDTVGMSAGETREYAMFLQNLNSARARFVRNEKADDVGFKMFLLNGSMRDALELEGVRKVSDFISQPLRRMRRAVKSWGMQLPKYVEYLHPDYVEKKQK